MHRTTLHLAKQNFKFSSAHFLIFDEKSAEMLHGHNYQVRVDLVCESDASRIEQGYTIDFNVLKKMIKAQCDLWDEHILLPARHADMKQQVSADGKNYEINFRDRFYSFPKNETIWLPVTNTSVENLSLLFAREMLEKMRPLGVVQLRVTVEETRGQSASSTLTA
jgi:6-pyruvoyltetrahydropterin/6-carboxytetrahydropterin synthase